MTWRAPCVEIGMTVEATTFSSIPMTVGGRASARDLPDGPALRALSRRSDLRGAVQLGRHLACMATTGTLIWLALPFWYLLLPAMVLHGITIVTMFAPMHECVHRTAFASRRANDAVGWVTGVLGFYNATFYRYFHAWHHRYTQDPARDPELMYPKASDRLAYFKEITGFTFWYRRAIDYPALALGRMSNLPFVPAHARRADHRAHRMQQRWQRAQQHAHHAGLSSNPAADVEHAVPRRAPSLPVDPISPITGVARKNPRSIGACRARLSHDQSSDLPVTLGSVNDFASNLRRRHQPARTVAGVDCLGGTRRASVADPYRRLVRIPVEGRAISWSCIASIGRAAKVAPTPAGHRMTILIIGLRLSLPTCRLGVRAARRKAAAGRQPRRTRRLAVQRSRAKEGVGLEPRHRLEQRAGIGVARRGEYLVDPR